MNNYTFKILSLTIAAATIVSAETSIINDEVQSCTSNKQTTQLLEPTSYFPQKTRQIVEAANNISTKAVSIDEYPTIDISPWLNSSYTDSERRNVVLQVLEQATGAGSFNIVGHEVPINLLNRLESSAAQFFRGETIATKNGYIIQTPGSQTGYIPFANEALSIIHQTDHALELSDLRELYSVIYPPSYHTNIVAPDYFQIAMNEYMDILQSVENALESIMSQALTISKGVEVDLHEDYPLSTGLLKVSHYTKQSSEYDGANKLLAHSDWSSMTILYAQQDGLEEIRDGRWVNVPMNKGELHVSIGELYTVWSNELFTNNIHRVSSQAVDDRLSFAYFFGQGQKEGSRYMKPIVAATEVPKFPIWSTLTQMATYSEALKPL